MAERVQIPAYTDRWMMGDRYGEVVKVVKSRIPGADGNGVGKEVAHVKLDKSGKVMTFWYDDCTPV